MATTKIEGSLFVRKSCGKIYFKFRGKQYATGCDDNKQGWVEAKTYQKEFIANFNKVSYEKDKLYYPQAILLFAEYLKTQSLTNRTIRVYFLMLLKFKDAVGTQVVNEKMFNDLTDFIRSKNHQKYKTLQYKMTMVKMLYNFLLKNKYISFSDINFDIGKSPDPEINYYYSEEEVSQIIKALQYYKVKKRTPEASKNISQYPYIFLFMLLTGARINETLKLEWSQIDFEECCLTFQNKKVKSQYDTISLSSSAIEVLEYMKSLNISKTRVFLPDETSVMAEYQRLNVALNRILESMKIKERAKSTHTFRKTFITNLIKLEIPLLAVKELARHTDINMTLAIYNKYNYRTNKKYADILGGITPSITPNSVQNVTKSDVIKKNGRTKSPIKLFKQKELAS